MSFVIRFRDGMDAKLDLESGEWLTADTEKQERLAAEVEFWRAVARPASYDPTPTDSMVDFVASNLHAEVVEREAPGAFDPAAVY